MTGLSGIRRYTQAGLAEVSLDGFAAINADHEAKALSEKYSSNTVPCRRQRGLNCEFLEVHEIVREGKLESEIRKTRRTRYEPRGSDGHHDKPGGKSCNRINIGQNEQLRRHS